jgi:hypothetical protein
MTVFWNWWLRYSHWIARLIFLLLVIFIAHHREWLNSVSPTNKHGRAALDFHNASSFPQLVDFPTHVHGNTLDLGFTDVPALALVSDLGCIGSSLFRPFGPSIRYQYSA